MKKKYFKDEILMLERKLSLRLVKLFGLALGIALLFSCNLENAKSKMKEHQQCQRQILTIDSFIKLSENKLSFIKNTIEEIQNRDSLMTVIVFQDNLIKDNLNKNTEISKEQMDTFIERNLAKTSCLKFNKEKKQLKNILTQLKQIEIECDNYFVIIDKLAMKDSVYRKKIGLDFAPFETLFKATVNSSDTTFLEFDCAKQLDTKINKLSMQTYIISRAQDESIEYLKSIKYTL